MPACGFIKASGDACKAIPMKGEGWCYVHHPEYVDKRRRDGAKGARRGGRGRPGAATVEAARITRRLEGIADDVLEKRLPRADGAVVAQILNYCLRGIQVGIQADEHGNLAAEVAEIREWLETREGSRSWG